MFKNPRVNDAFTQYVNNDEDAKIAFLNSQSMYTIKDWLEEQVTDGPACVNYSDNIMKMVAAITKTHSFRELIRDKKKIQAVKMIKDHVRTSGEELGLRAAVDIVDSFLFMYYEMPF